MHIEIRLVARLLRIPLLRVEGAVVLRDVARSGDLRGVAPRPGATRVGRDLAVAEAIMAELESQR
ncbi:hypothetical protein ACNHYB_07430 [Isoptericola jiangsuensis]|uniref:hypothetical protein n=1 Tax=Isoptericola jiangsuensis TaxID=548579 RepID=UPI003AAFAD70